VITALGVPRAGSLWRVVVGSSIAAFAAVAAAAASLSPPAAGVADRYLALAAVASIAAVLAAASAGWRTFARPQRLGAFVLLVASAMAWHAGRLWIHERQFDYLVASQREALRLAAVELSGDILDFLAARARTVPPSPAPATWDRDVAGVLAYESDTAGMYEARFGPAVRRAHDLFALEGLDDRDLDVFYRRPANAFQIRIVARRLAFLAGRLNHL
jgi:hypothetical protein